MLDVVDTNNKEKADHDDVDQGCDAREVIKGWKFQEYEHEYGSGNKLNQRILPRYLALTLLADTTLCKEAENRYKLLPRQRLTAGHTMRTTTYTPPRVEAQSDDIEETTDNGTKYEWKEERRCKHEQKI